MAAPSMGIKDVESLTGLEVVSAQEQGNWILLTLANGWMWRIRKW